MSVSALNQKKSPSIQTPENAFQITIHVHWACWRKQEADGILCAWFLSYRKHYERFLFLLTLHIFVFLVLITDTKATGYFFL